MLFLAASVGGILGASVVAPASGSADGGGRSVAKSPAPPRAGRWQAHPTAEREIVSGSFTVTKGHRDVTNLRLAPGNSGAEGYCGNAVVKILGKQPIHRVAGTGEGGHYDVWVVGRNAPKRQPPIQPIRVKEQQGGDTPYSAQLTLVFHGGSGSKSRTSGYVGFTTLDSGCTMQFSFTRKA